MDFFFQLAQLLGEKKHHDDVVVQIMAMLIQAGASLDAKNKRGETPLTLCKDSSTREFMQRYNIHAKKTEFAAGFQ